MRQLLLMAGLLLPLALDTFALAGALGVAGLEKRDRLRVTLVFTVFEAAMPIAGILIGRAVGNAIGDWAGYTGIAFLLVAGLLLLRPGKDEADEERRLRLLAHARGLAILDLGLSISIDELTVGLSAGLLGVPLAIAVIWIALQAFAAAQFGFQFGNRLGEELRARSEQAAGVALIAVALVLLALKLLKI
ncbi:MAG TPA: manganese efflux pump [Candidatus Dormibacteraeota bacterium]|nr:manganese efflux pump [Candidatus Dormibacteraeota bacterium]